MDLYLRKVIHPQARDNYRVLLKDDGLEVEVGPIGIQHGAPTRAGYARCIPIGQSFSGRIDVC